MWTRIVAKKWLRIGREGTGNYKFNADSDIEDPKSPKPEINAEDENSSKDNACNNNNINNISRLMLGESEDSIWKNCVDRREYRIFVGTWNVGGHSPPKDEDMEAWLKGEGEEEADIYVIGLQEAVPLNAGKVFGPDDQRSGQRWDKVIRDALNIKKKTRMSTIASSSFNEKENEEDTEHTCIQRSSSAPHGDLSSPSMIEHVNRENGNELDALHVSLHALSEGAKRTDRPRFRRVASRQMVGIFITVWIRSHLRRHVHDVCVSCVGCGVMGCMGNKGSVTVSLRLDDTFFCFVCAHLASGQKEGDELKRNMDVADIMKRTQFPDRDTTPKPPVTILAHDRIIWFGDLNYRLCLPLSEAMQSIQKEDWETLLKSDQLKREQRRGKTFDGWQEGQINFPPTYKFVPHLNRYSGTQTKQGEKRRVPAWCDRIMWYGKGLKQLSYKSFDHKFSDHKPVYATFITEVEGINNRKLYKKMNLSFKLMEAQEVLDKNKSKRLPMPKKISHRRTGASLSNELFPDLTDQDVITKLEEDTKDQHRHSCDDPSAIKKKHKRIVQGRHQVIVNRSLCVL